MASNWASRHRDSGSLDLEQMIPIGYMAKRICESPEILNAAAVVDIYSISSCVNDDFADYIDFWKHNGYWFFNAPRIIETLAEENSINLDGMKLFYYEAHEQEFDGQTWCPYRPNWEDPEKVVVPVESKLEGFDVVTFFAGSSAECSPLSCNGLASKIETNQHCLLNSFEAAEDALNSGKFAGGEPGPHRIFAVYSVDWPALSKQHSNSR